MPPVSWQSRRLFYLGTEHHELAASGASVNDILTLRQFSIRQTHTHTHTYCGPGRANEEHYASTSTFIMNSLRRRCCCKPTAHCNKSREPVDQPEKFCLRHKLRPALQIMTIINNVGTIFCVTCRQACRRMASILSWKTCCCSGVRPLKANNPIRQPILSIY